MYSQTQNFVDNCAIVASFRIGKGSALAMGSSDANLVTKSCEDTTVLDSLAEHIGHTADTIDEYCANMIPDSTTMEVLKAHSPTEIIESAKQGQFLLTSVDLYIVTKKRGIGECLFFADQKEKPPQWGAAICTCDRAGCNNQDALNLS
jgi:hypothetical protein